MNAVPSYLGYGLRRVGVDAVDGVDVGVGTGVECEVDRGYVGRYRARHQVAQLQAPVAAVDAKAHDVALLWQLATEAVTFKSPKLQFYVASCDPIPLLYICYSTS